MTESEMQAEAKSIREDYTGSRRQQMLRELRARYAREQFAATVAAQPQAQGTPYCYRPEDEEDAPAEIEMEKAPSAQELRISRALLSHVNEELIQGE